MQIDICEHFPRLVLDKTSPDAENQVGCSAVLRCFVSETFLPTRGATHTLMVAVPCSEALCLRLARAYVEHADGRKLQCRAQGLYI